MFLILISKKNYRFYNIVIYCNIVITIYNVVPEVLASEIRKKKVIRFVKKEIKSLGL